MGFARNVGFGLKDFISASRKGKLQVCKCKFLARMAILYPSSLNLEIYGLLVLQSPVELLNGLAQGSKTLIGSTVYAVSSATSHFSKTAYKVFMLMASLIIKR